MTRISKASTLDFNAAFSLVRYLFLFSRWAMYSVAFDKTVAYTLISVYPETSGGDYVRM
jgi:hypothetical protein